MCVFNPLSLKFRVCYVTVSWCDESDWLISQDSEFCYCQNAAKSWTHKMTKSFQFCSDLHFDLFIYFIIIVIVFWMVSDLWCWKHILQWKLTHRTFTVECSKKQRQCTSCGKIAPVKHHLSSLPTIPLHSTGAANFTILPDPSRTSCSFKWRRLAASSTYSKHKSQ